MGNSSCCCSSARRRDRGVQAERGFAGNRNATKLTALQEISSVVLGGSPLERAEGLAPKPRAAGTGPRRRPDFVEGHRVRQATRRTNSGITASPHASFSYRECPVTSERSEHANRTDHVCGSGHVGCNIRRDGKRSAGRALYLFTADHNNASSCYDACAGAWPPFTVTGKPGAGTGLEASKLGAISRKDGTQQVTYNGHPLYYYAVDSAAGSTEGEDIDHFGGEWYLVSPKGNKIEKD